MKPGLPATVWLNDGAGVFSDSGQTLGGSRSFGVSLGDLDGDGGLDAFVANEGQANLVYMNEPPAPPVLCGDCNGDRRIDILDAQTASLIASGLVTCAPGGDCEYSCNTRGIPLPSGGISVLDSLEIARYVVGLASLQCILLRPCSCRKRFVRCLCRPAGSQVGQGVIMNDAPSLLQTALALTPEERLELAVQLLDSVEGKADPDWTASPPTSGRPKFE